MSLDAKIAVRFYPPPADLACFFTTFYYTDIDPGSAAAVSDSLHPEWAGLRFFETPCAHGWIGEGTRISDCRFFATGPTIVPINFILPRTRMWGVGLLPLGWARFVGGSAADHANLLADGDNHPSFAAFRELAKAITCAPENEQADLQRLIAFFRQCPPPGRVDQERIRAIHEALIDPELATVVELVERVGIGQRTLERICHRHFGFSPKLLLRRQRFMRSLSQFMLDPSLKWIGAIDGLYHDQAQFVRDFHEFMGMTPREYAAQPHPVLGTFVRERARLHGTPVQTLDRPDGSPPLAEAAE